ncbi:MAG: 16S rRNA (guanine(966)-N(2))-methyltransferase RsmD [Deferrisomatales bacterium]
MTVGGGTGAVRITSGRLRGRRVETPPGERTRPLLTRLRKSLADILRPRLEGARVLDLFAGSGAIAFELLSNGARRAVAVELDPATAELVRRNARALGVADAVDVREGDALAWIPRLAAAGERFDVVVVAPPYGRDLHRRAIAELEAFPLLREGGLLVAQRDVREPPAEPAGHGLRLHRTRTYGRTAFDFYAWEPGRTPSEP